MLSRMILTYRNHGSEIPKPDLADLRAMSGVVILSTSPRCVIVEAAESSISEFVSRHANWSIGMERSAALFNPKGPISDR